jgi:hypothetical protein
MKLKYFAVLFTAIMCFSSCGNEEEATDSFATSSNEERIAQVALAFAKSINDDPSTRGVSGKEMSVKGVYKLAIRNNATRSASIGDGNFFFTVPMNANLGTVVVATNGNAVCPVAYFKDENAIDPNTVMEDTVSDAAYIVQTVVNMDDSFQDMSQMPDKEEPSTPSIRIVERMQPKCKVFWDQDDPYNEYCPMIDTVHAAAGCVAVAGAEALTVLRPKMDLATSWDELVKEPYYRSAEATDEMKQLIYKISVAVHTSYGIKKSGANVAYLSELFSKYGIVDYGIKHMIDVLKTEHGIVVVSGFRAKHGWGPTKHYVDGHVFLADGYVKYNTERNPYYFHLNYGWGIGYAKDVYVLSNEMIWDEAEARKAYGTIYPHKMNAYSYTYESEKNWN